MSNYSPVILIGNGCRSVGIPNIANLNIPILTTWMAADLIPEDHPAFCGRPGILGQRAANIIQQKATHLYCFGARLDGEQVAYDYDRFAPDAKVFVWDIDEKEYLKFPDRYEKIDEKAHIELPEDTKWLDECKALYKKHRPELDGGDELDPFSLVRLFSEEGKPDDVFALGSSGTAPCAFYQAFKVKEGQRVSNVSTIGAMGADIPMALGAAVGSKKRTICFTGDGGFQLNAQELETIHRLHLPVTFYVLNNDGYSSIRNMQNVRYDGNHVGCDSQSGLTLPPLEELANAYSSMYRSMKTLEEFPGFADFPMVVEVFVDPEWQQFPRVMASNVDGELRTDDMNKMSPRITS